MRRYIHLPIFASNPNADGAVWTDPDANTIGGWQLDADTETLFFGTEVFFDWDVVSDLNVQVHFAKNTAGGAGGDTVDLRLQCYYNTAGDTATKTQTVEVATTVGADAQYTVYTVDFTIDYDFAANNVEEGDIMGFILNLETDTSECDDIIVLQTASFTYVTEHLGIEAGDI